ncbi:hypothetical protein MTR67_003841 [Solanum verrucosum]|uniref:Uncharacterized protein n=1 Tax=Solanum verrucosum TaxID=315347 RepID=A0AAF0PTG1_SOLVR|nr:hypothetical protein MTR67_003841 [Solanum verrucosum]
MKLSVDCLSLFKECEAQYRFFITLKGTHGQMFNHECAVGIEADELLLHAKEVFDLYLNTCSHQGAGQFKQRKPSSFLCSIYMSQLTVFCRRFSTLEVTNHLKNPGYMISPLYDLFYAQIFQSEEITSYCSWWWLLFCDSACAATSILNVATESKLFPTKLPTFLRTSSWTVFKSCYLS